MTYDPKRALQLLRIGSGRGDATFKGIDHFARLVENGDIAENGYNIAVSSHVEQADTSEADLERDQA